MKIINQEEAAKGAPRVFQFEDSEAELALAKKFWEATDMQAVESTIVGLVIEALTGLQKKKREVFGEFYSHIEKQTGLRPDGCSWDCTNQTIVEIIKSKPPIRPEQEPKPSAVSVN